MNPGTQLGPYEIVSKLGAGGMGEVYRARDTRLDRSVAIKILSATVSANPGLKERFEREARIISQLQHPHICTLFDVGHQDSLDFLVMEFLDGESLADRLTRGPLPLKQALEIGIQIAEALEKAHRAGVTHRDLKPGNIMLTKSGAKLLDFGLAKPAPTIAAAASAATVATVSKPLTSEGTLVGTFQYMSPEQLQGQEADSRSDIFAFGAVLYEMLTGRRAFSGKSQISVLSAILERDPEPLSAAQPLTPPALEHAIRRALEKDPDRRWQSAADLAGELRWIAESPSSISAAPSLPAISRHRWRKNALWLGALVAAIVAGIALGIFLRPERPQPSIRTLVLPPEKASLSLTGDFAGPPVISPDGAYLAFTAADADGHSMLWLRPMDSLEAHQLAGTQGAIFPFWSPDSRSIAFFADSKLKITDLNGGAPLAIADAASGRGGTWAPNGLILYTPDTQAPIMRIEAGGGTPADVTKIDVSRHSSHRWPFMLPDGKHFLYLAVNHDPAKSSNDEVYYASLDGRENRMLGHSECNAIYANGYALFARDTQLMAQPFDPASGKLSGQPTRLADGVVNDLSTWHMDASASNTGLLTLGTGGSADFDLVWLDRSGKLLGTAAGKLANILDARLSPQGDRLAIPIDNGLVDIWILDLARGVRSRLTFGENAYSGNPVWSPDGKFIAYAAGEHTTMAANVATAIYVRNSDGGGTPKLLIKDNYFNAPFDWSRDGKFLLFDRFEGAYHTTSNEEIWALPLTGDQKPFKITTSGAAPMPRRHSLSPDGRWLAYVSTEAGASPEIYVIPFPSGQGKWQVSQGGNADSPVWSSDGKELFYAAGNSLMSVAVSQTGGDIHFGPPQKLFDNPNAQNPIVNVAPGSKKFLVARVIQQTNQPITIISNWPAELKK